jgi:hypothetical protein
VLTIFMALLSFRGISTPSLPAQGEQRRSFYFNIRRDIPGELERSGLITRGRQQIMIRDPKGLMGASCECYQLVRKRITFHLPKTYASVLACP